MKIIVSGGGTGGHIYPALSIIKEAKKHHPELACLFVGTPQGLEADIVKQTDIPFEEIHITGFKRKLSYENVKTIYHFIRGVQKSKQLLRSFKPDIVIGTGGYVCGPVVYAAAKLEIPTLLHEQNIIPGLTNAFLSRYTDGVAVSFDGSANMFKKASSVKITGNPRATEVIEANGLAGKRSLSISLTKRVILVVGGSRGAKAINKAFVDMLPSLQQLKDCHIVYVTGEVHYQQVMEDIEKCKVSLEHVSIKPFIYNMPDVLAATDLIINRAGASFLAEITALGLPSILIPSPYVTNNHQEKNARWLEGRGAAKVILEKDLTGNSLFKEVSLIMKNRNTHEQMKKASKALGKPDASNSIYKYMTELIKNKQKIRA
jgi:UDP-N-acetylglucosamine--N-acetylmuramyl-(pentapeptide) pyrophosphoryl-undecaprenol N-acetylglucosamine transferase